MKNLNPYIKSFAASFMASSCIVSLATVPSTLASDHVDSPSVAVVAPAYRDAALESSDPLSAKPIMGSSKPEDITDIYTFRDQDQSGNAADAGRMTLVMTLNGLQAPGQSRAFAPDVAYQFKVATNKAALDAAATTKTLSFRFGLPDPTTGAQQIYLSNNETPSNVSIGSTTAFNATPNVITTATYNGQAIKVFAGEMDDPFYLDFRVLNEGLPFGVKGAGSVNRNRTPGDSFGGSNANAIVVSLPIAAVQSTGAAEAIFYTWGRTLK